VEAQADMSRGSILLTGATGFLGMEVLARLLEHDDREVLASCARRHRRRRGARRRRAARLWRDPAPYRERVRAVPATSPAGSASSPAGRCSPDRTGTVLHCAASISFDLPLDEARRVNVEGTRQVIALAREARENGSLQRFIHVSTRM
jgi:nucleoside-diphosphate-sugar epimerase